MQRALNQNVVLNQTQTLSVKLLDIAWVNRPSVSCSKSLRRRHPADCRWWLVMPRVFCRRQYGVTCWQPCPGRATLTYVTIKPASCTAVSMRHATRNRKSVLGGRTLRLNGWRGVVFFFIIYPRRRRSMAARNCDNFVTHDVCRCVGGCVYYNVSTIKRKPLIGMTWNLAQW